MFKSVALVFAAIALANGATLEERRVSRPPVCGGNTVAACCQTTDAEVFIRGASPIYESTDCVSPGSPTSIKKFRKYCAATGRTAQCCQDVVDNTGDGCQDV